MILRKIARLAATATFRANDNNLTRAGKAMKLVSFFAPDGQITFDATGYMKALTNASGLATVELHPTPRLVVYVNYGEDFAGRLNTLAAGSTAGYGLLTVNNSGCNVESSTPTSGSVPSGAPANCTGNNKFVQETAAGLWYDFYKGAAGRVRYGIQYANVNRAIWGGTTTPEAVATDNLFYTSFRYYLP